MGEENIKKYNEDDVNFVKLGNYVITLRSAVLRENNQICVKAIIFLSCRL